MTAPKVDKWSVGIATVLWDRSDMLQYGMVVLKNRNSALGLEGQALEWIDRPPEWNGSPWGEQLLGAAEVFSKWNNNPKK